MEQGEVSGAEVQRARPRTLSGDVRMDEAEEEDMELDVHFSKGSASEIVALQGMIGTREGEAVPPTTILSLAASLIFCYQSERAYPDIRTLIYLLRIVSLVSVSQLDRLLDAAAAAPSPVDVGATARRFVGAVVTWVKLKELTVLEGIDEEIQGMEVEFRRNKLKKPRISTPDPVGLVTAAGE